MKKKVLAALLAGAMTVTLGACGGNTGSGNDTSKADDNTQGTTDTADVSKDAIRFMNTKIEIDGALKEFAKQYQEETGSCDRIPGRRRGCKRTAQKLLCSRQHAGHLCICCRLLQIFF